VTLTADVSGRGEGEYVSTVDTTDLPQERLAAIDAARELGLRVGRALLAAGAGPYVSPSTNA
jgi:hypothetical protein